MSCSATAVFLDRDGVINRKAPDGRYIATWREMHFLPGVVTALSAVRRAGIEIIVVTNQRGIALGQVRLGDLEELHARMRAHFAQCGVVIAGIYFCPHDISEYCFCRKPKPGMLLQAAKDHALDLRASWMIGDAAGDIEAGRSAGCKTVRIMPLGPPLRNEVQADSQARDLSSAVRKILQYLRRHNQSATLELHVKSFPGA